MTVNKLTFNIGQVRAQVEPAAHGSIPSRTSEYNKVMPNSYTK